ncbi:MAG: nucleotidyltransferase domain-containing protein [Prevotella sp.]|nr:nucleotidyltransferase domain-containing protein [Prevotella sp.]
MDQKQAIELVRQYKQVIAPHFDGKAKVYLFGSYSKGYARPGSDIDVAVIVPSFGDNWWKWTKSLWHDVRKVSTLIEPVLMEEDSHSPLYDDVMRTGLVVE